MHPRHLQFSSVAAATDAATATECCLDDLRWNVEVNLLQSFVVGVSSFMVTQG